MDKCNWWGSDPEFPIEDWKCLVMNNETRLGYHQWVDNEKEQGHPQQEPEK